MSALVVGHQVATAESCTAGLVAQALAQLPDASEWFRGGLVAYGREMKVELLGVTPGPVVTEEAATEMARGAQRLFSADVAVSVTGAAGPAPYDGAEPGTVIIGVAVGDAVTATTQHFEGRPSVVCVRAQAAAMQLLADALRPRVATSDRDVEQRVPRGLFGRPRDEGRGNITLAKGRT